MAADTASACEAIKAALDSLGLTYERPEPGAYLVRLEGEHKLATLTWLIAGEHSLQVEAFFCRQPDENHAEFYRFLLTRNARMYGVHFALDKAEGTWRPKRANSRPKKKSPPKRKTKRRRRG